MRLICIEWKSWWFLSQFPRLPLGTPGITTVVLCTSCKYEENKTSCRLWVLLLMQERLIRWRTAPKTFCTGTLILKELSLSFCLIPVFCMCLASVDFFNLRINFVTNLLWWVLIEMNLMVNHIRLFQKKSTPPLQKGYWKILGEGLMVLEIHTGGGSEPKTTVLARTKWTTQMWNGRGYGQGYASVLTSVCVSSDTSGKKKGFLLLFTVKKPKTNSWVWRSSIVTHSKEPLMRDLIEIIND